MVCYLLFYPHLYTSLDESANYGMAYVLRHGTIYPARAGFDLAMSENGPYGPIYRFPIGFPIVLAIASFLGAKAIYFINPLFHVLAALAFWRLLRLLKLPYLLTAFYLFFPAFSLYSRTIFSDPFAASLITIAIYFIAAGGGKRDLLAGLCLGLAALSRSTATIIAVIFLVYLFAEDYRNRYNAPLWRGQAVYLLAGIMPFAVLGAFYNHFATGGMLKSTYSASEFSFANFIKFGPQYAISLLVLYPGMLFVPFIYRGRFWPVAIAGTTLVFIMASSYEESTFGENRIENLVAVARQLLPVMPFYLLAYCSLLASFARKQVVLKALAPAACVCLVFSCLAISYMHQKKLHELARIQIAIRTALPPNSVVYANKDVLKLHQPMWDGMVYRNVLTVSDTRVLQDLQTRPCFVVLYKRSRGIPNEDGQYEMVKQRLSEFELSAGPATPDRILHILRVTGLNQSDTAENLPGRMIN